MNERKLISVVVPCFNEQEVLQMYYDEMKKVMKSTSEVDFELIFVDDGSRDKTLEIIIDFHKKDKRCRYISLSRNFGKESAMYAGFVQALGYYIVVMDVDLQDPPSHIPMMYAIMSQGKCDCVATRRCNRTGEKRIRSFLSATFYKVINKISETEIPDGSRDYRMMSRKMVNAILEMSEYNRFSKGLFSWVGFKTKYIGRINSEVKHRPIYIIGETSDEKDEVNKRKNKKNRNNLYPFANGYSNDSYSLSCAERVPSWYKE